MSLRRVLRGGAELAGDLVVGLVFAAALLLTPFRLGRLLRTVSIPRFSEHRLRTSLTVVGISLGVAVLVAVAIVNRSILKSIAATIDDVAGKADLEVSAGSSGFDEALADRVRDVTGVYKAAVAIEQTVTNRDAGAEGERMLVLGIDFLNGDDDYFRKYASSELEAIEKDPVRFLNSPYNIVVSRKVAKEHDYRLHDRILLQTPLGQKPFEIWGFMGDEGVGKAFGGAVAVMDYGAMQVAFDRGENVDRIDVAVRPGTDVDQVARAIRGAVGPSFTVERPERKNERVSHMLSTLRNGLATGSIVALIVGMFLIYNTISISVVQRRREIGTLRALGATRRDLVRLFTLEGTLFGVVGSAIGVAIGVVLARAMLSGVEQSVTEMFMAVSASVPAADRTLLAASAATGVVVTTLASAFPARAAAFLDPVDTLRSGPAVRAAPLPRRPTRSEGVALGLVGCGLLAVTAPPVAGFPAGPAAACLLFAVTAALLSPRLVQATHAVTARVLRGPGSIETRLAADNLPRNVGRTSITISALMVGVAMVTAFAVFVGSFETSTVEWVDQTLPADLWISSAARVAGGGEALPMGSELSAPLAALPGVDVVERVKMDDLEYRGFPVKLVATEIAAAGPRIRLVMLEGTQADALRRMRTGAVVVAENFSRRFDVHLGDRIALATKSGTRWFDVAGVVVDYTSDTGMLMIDRATYLADFGDDRVDTYKIYMKRGAPIEPVRREIDRRFSERYDLFVLTNKEFRDEVVGMLDQAFAGMYVLEAVAIVISVLGVVNALFANVLDRIREIAVLRAVGMRRGQTVKMILFEGWLVGVMGAIGGVVLGLAIGLVLLRYINVTQTGWRLPFRPSWSGIFTGTSLVVTCSTLAGFYPARQAARLVIAEALGYE